MKMKRFKIGLAIVAFFYVAIIQGPAGVLFITPSDGTVEEVKIIREQREILFSQWSPITGLWCAK